MPDDDPMTDYSKTVIHTGSGLLWAALSGAWWLLKGFALLFLYLIIFGLSLQHPFLMAPIWISTIIITIYYWRKPPKNYRG